MKKYITTVVTALVVVFVFFVLSTYVFNNDDEVTAIKVGFIYESDESTSYTSNFINAEKEVKKEYGESVEILTKKNISEDSAEKTFKELISDGCDIIFATSSEYVDISKKIAGENPGVQICQATGANANEEPLYDNYHTFMGEIYEGRYVSGIAAGMKIDEMIKKGIIKPSEAKVGYIAAFPNAEVISGYTAFFLGIRQIVPEAVMKVRYTNTWSGYSIEKRYAEEFIKDGCVIISQHSDTTGPATACEEMNDDYNVYHVGYNQSMTDVAPKTSLISSRINWTPYIVAAVSALMKNKTIESVVEGNVHGNDIGAGFDLGWVQMLDLNELIAAEGTQDTIEETIKGFSSKTINVFKGNYEGVNPDDPSDVYDLSKGYTENKDSSAPTFNYVLKDVIRIIE